MLTKEYGCCLLVVAFLLVQIVAQGLHTIKNQGAEQAACHPKSLDHKHSVSERQSPSSRYGEWTAIWLPSGPAELATPAAIFWRLSHTCFSLTILHRYQCGSELSDHGCLLPASNVLVNLSSHSQSRTTAAAISAWLVARPSQTVLCDFDIAPGFPGPAWWFLVSYMSHGRRPLKSLGQVPT